MLNIKYIICKTNFIFDLMFLTTGIMAKRRNHNYLQKKNMKNQFSDYLLHINLYRNRKLFVYPINTY